MENCRSIGLAVFLAAIASTAQAQDKPVAMDGPAIIAAFEGRTVAGAYVEGKPFRETYALGGAIDYWDSDTTTLGQWSVANNLLCTFYDGLAGGCFRVVQVSNNCFDYYTATTDMVGVAPPDETLFYTARGSVSHLASTCPVDLQA